MTPLLITDGNCGFCQSSAKWLMKNFPGDWINTPSQSVDLDRIGLSQEQVQSKVWYVTERGDTTVQYGGAQAVAKMLLGQPKAWIKPVAFMAFVPVAKQLADLVYFLIAKNRKHFGPSKCVS